mmetsp:Transcript_11681/g.42088  ORF Transcript_11681/g.42088 Transcript_11681/m.42088 type:complete len:263 (-) Transcript_11681:502-1290(-)
MRPHSARKYGRGLNAAPRSSVSRIAVRAMATSARPRSDSRDAIGSDERRHRSATRRTYASTATNDSAGAAPGGGVPALTSEPRQCVTASSTRMRRNLSCVSSCRRRPFARFVKNVAVAASPEGRSCTLAHSSKCCATVSRRPTGSGSSFDFPPPPPPSFFSPFARACSTSSATFSGAPGRAHAFASASKVAVNSAGATHGSTMTQCCTMCTAHSIAGVALAPPPRMSFARCASSSPKNCSLTTPARTRPSVMSLFSFLSSSA